MSRKSGAPQTPQNGVDETHLALGLDGKNFDTIFDGYSDDNELNFVVLCTKIEDFENLDLGCFYDEMKAFCTEESFILQAEERKKLDIYIEEKEAELRELIEKGKKTFGKDLISI